MSYIFVQEKILKLHDFDYLHVMGGQSKLFIRNFFFGISRMESLSIYCLFQVGRAILQLIQKEVKNTPQFMGHIMLSFVLEWSTFPF